MTWMRSRGAWTRAAGLALAFVNLGGRVALADDPPAPAPAPSTDATRADALDRQVERLYRDGKFADALPLARESLALRERAFGKDHPSVAISLNNLGGVLEAQGAFTDARPLYERALAIQEATLGRAHPLVAVSLNNLAGLLQTLGDLARAQALLERAIAIKEEALGKADPSVADTLSHLGAVLRSRGAYVEARRALERALAIDEAARGRDDPAVAADLNNLAVVVVEQGAYAEARPLYERALAIREAKLGKDHPAVATSLNNLAVFLKSQGVYAVARPLCERALDIFERALGKEHPSVAMSLNNLASLLQAQGAYAEARPLYERALAIDEKAYGADHPEIAVELNNIAGLLKSQGAYAEARPLYRRALSIRESRLGKDHPAVAQSLNNLASLLHSEGAYAEARPLYERAITIREATLGKDHPALAESLNNLASLLQASGRFAEARPLFDRALAIYGHALGEDHPYVALTLGNIAGLLETEGSLAAAQPFFERALRMTERHVRDQLSALSPSQRLGLVRSTRYRLDNWLRFAPKVGLSGYPEVLRLRGLVARAESAERTLSRHATGDDRRLQGALSAARGRAARLANQAPASLRPEARAAWQKACAEAAAERETLTRELTTRMAPLRAALERLDLGVGDVQAVLGPDGALVELLRVGSRYVAWVVSATGEAVRVDVGAADAVDAACGEFVSAIVDDADRTATGAALRALVWAPIEAKLGKGVVRVVICPDAALAAVPFGALPGRDPGRSVLDDYALSHVLQAQDLVPWKDPPPAGRGALVVGGVDYDHADVGSSGPPSAPRPEALALSDRAPAGASFPSLPATKAEAEALRDLLGKDTTTLLLGADATEARLRTAATGKRFVHVATHGFSRQDLFAGLYTRRIAEPFTSADTERQLAVGHDPMLLSGLALAGANSREGANGDDGVLTALEASYLDLDGVDLVTLSACETAKGTAESGEGVLGLVSAFQMAGAHRVIASLWKVDDEATRRLMEGVYERILRVEDPLGPADALRQAALALRAWKDPAGKARFAAPRYWAAFVAYGA